MAPVVIIFLLFMPAIIGSPEFPVFRVVIDPGHGGVGKSPMSVHGDRYDTIYKRYLDVFKEGAERGGLHERTIVYSIAKKTEKILKLLGPNGNREKFYRILERYSDDTPREATIQTYMSRGGPSQKKKRISRGIRTRRTGFSIILMQTEICCPGVSPGSMPLNRTWWCLCILQHPVRGILKE